MGSPTGNDAAVPDDSARTVIGNPMLPENRPDPYPIYHQMREADPVHRAVDGTWVITRYEDASAVLRSPKVSNNPVWLGETTTNSPARMVGPSLMMFLDPPDHTRVRSLVSQAFTARVVEGLRPRVQAIVDSLLDAVEAKGTMDVVGDFAYPLPVIVICELLGLPSEDLEAFKQWSSDASLLLEGTLEPDAKERAFVAAAYLFQQFTELVEVRRLSPGSDLLSALIAAEEAGDQLSHAELISTATLLFVAGHETTMNLIANGVLALLRNPGELHRLQADPSLIRTAVEEFLRYDSPVHVTARIATEDMDVAGRAVAKGEQMAVMLGAVNRDPAQFPDPDSLDLSRSPNRHLAFAAGPHFCLGASLARLEAQVAIATLVRRMPELELVTEEPQYREHFVLRGFEQLQVRFPVAAPLQAQ